MYVINLVPALAGRPITELLLVYFNQAGYDSRLSGDCANICFLFYHLDIVEGMTTYKVIIILMTAVTLALLFITLVLALKRNKVKQLSIQELIFVGFIMSFIMVLFMPKMLDRFYYITSLLSIIWVAITKTNRSLRCCIAINLCFFLTLWVTLWCKSFYFIIMLAMVVMCVTFAYLSIYAVKEYKASMKKGVSANVIKNLVIDSSNDSEVQKLDESSQNSLSDENK